MEDLEQQLKNALARKDAPDWLEARVLAAAREPERGRGWRPSWMFGGRLRWASAVLAGVVVVSGVTWQQHERAVRERAAGEDAKARLELALRITSTKLRKIEQRLNEVGRVN